jgi:hypothetical protein
MGTTFQYSNYNNTTTRNNCKIHYTGTNDDSNTNDDPNTNDDSNTNDDPNTNDDCKIDDPTINYYITYNITYTTHNKII